MRPGQNIVAGINPLGPARSCCAHMDVGGGGGDADARAARDGHLKRVCRESLRFICAVRPLRLMLRFQHSTLLSPFRELLLVTPALSSLAPLPLLLLPRTPLSCRRAPPPLPPLSFSHSPTPCARSAPKLFSPFHQEGALLQPLHLSGPGPSSTLHSAEGHAGRRCPRRRRT